MQHKMRTLTETFAMLHGGTFTDECSEELKTLVKSVDQTGKPGKLTITLDIKKAGGALSLTANVTSKVPEPKPDADMFWATVEGNLSLSNPAQQSLDLKSIDAPIRELRSS